MMLLKAGETYKVLAKTWKSRDAIIEITEVVGHLAHFIVIEGSVYSSRNGRATGDTGKIDIRPLRSDHLEPYTIEPEEIPEVELQPTDFNDLLVIKTPRKESNTC